jgi:hypothetical protein
MANSLLLAFWLAAFYCVSGVIFGVAPFLWQIVYAIAGLAMFAIYCSCAGAYLIELERVEDDWDSLLQEERSSMEANRDVEDSLL